MTLDGCDDNDYMMISSWLIIILVMILMTISVENHIILFLSDNHVSKSKHIDYYLSTTYEYRR